jgi:hypothetical protein
MLATPQPIKRSLTSLKAKGTNVASHGVASPSKKAAPRICELVR